MRGILVIIFAFLMMPSAFASQEGVLALSEFKIQKWDEGSALDTGQIEANRTRYSGFDNQQSFFKSCDQALFPDPKTFNDRKEFPILDPAEEAVCKKVTFSTGSLVRH